MPFCIVLCHRLYWAILKIIVSYFAFFLFLRPKKSFSFLCYLLFLPVLPLLLTCTTSSVRRLHIALVQSGLLCLPIVCQIWRIMHQGPAVMSKHWWAPFPFVCALHCCNDLMETFTVLALTEPQFSGKKSRWGLRKWIFVDILHPSFW